MVFRADGAQQRRHGADRAVQLRGGGGQFHQVGCQ